LDGVEGGESSEGVVGEERLRDFRIDGTFSSNLELTTAEKQREAQTDS